MTDIRKSDAQLDAEAALRDGVVFPDLKRAWEFFIAFRGGQDNPDWLVGAPTDDVDAYGNPIFIVEFFIP